MFNRSARLKEFREKTGKSGTELANQLQISQSNYSAMEGGTRTIGRKMEAKILSTFRINPSWWETGEGEIKLPEELMEVKQDQETDSEKVQLYRQLVETQAQLIKTQAELLEERKAKNLDVDQDVQRLKNDTSVSDQT